MRGGGRILLALIVLVVLAAPIARAAEPLALPTDKTTVKTSVLFFSNIEFDGVLYRITTEVPCELLFERIDDGIHRLNIRTIPEGVVPYCEVVLQWGNFPPVTLGLGVGDDNSWLIGAETGYAEK